MPLIVLIVVGKNPLVRDPVEDFIHRSFHRVRNCRWSDDRIDEEELELMGRDERAASLASVLSPR